MLEYYLRKDDPLAPVYEIDTDANTWRMAASAIGVLPMGGEMKDGGATFRDPNRFDRVWPKSEDGEVVTYTLNEPSPNSAKED